MGFCHYNSGNRLTAPRRSSRPHLAERTVPRSESLDCTPAASLVSQRHRLAKKMGRRRRRRVFINQRHNFRPQMMRWCSFRPVISSDLISSSMPFASSSPTNDSPAMTRVHPSRIRSSGCEAREPTGEWLEHQRTTPTARDPWVTNVMESEAWSPFSMPEALT